MGREKSDEVRLGGTLRFMQLLWELVHAMEARSRRMVSEMGVTGPQRLVIRLVGKHGGISAGRLAEAMKIHPSTLTGILSRLVERAFVERHPDPEDARRAVLTLTESGRVIDGKRAGTVEAAIGRALARMPAQDVVAAERVLASIADELGREDV
ncbi:MAG: MarR family transcriptional regulator [Deltaproteobacteria bacterium]|nr:MarR family transcriptional regulator [Deltaproteobacteria bacterium]